MIVGVEVIQYIWKVGSADIDDIILNMSGVLILYIVLKIPFIKKIILKSKITSITHLFLLQ